MANLKISRPKVARILVVPDKFKGTLTAKDAAAAMASGWKQARPGDQIEILPMSDGGDGFGEVIGQLHKAKPQWTRTVDATHRPIRVRWWFNANDKTALVDSANIIGLAMLPPGKFHPFQLDTLGLGAVMRAVLESGAQEMIIGIGGSATNDGGFGMARALSWKFFDDGWNEIEEWWRLHELAHVRPPKQPFACKVTMAVDVSNPLLGKNGCSRIYGPQKGLRQQDFALAEKCLSRLALILRKQAGVDYAKMPGAGAAGGLGFGLTVFAGAKMKPGFEIFSEASELEKRIRAADLVITGEGRIDLQTYMGKGVGRIALLCRKWKVPCVALAGAVVPHPRGRSFFAHSRGLLDHVDEMDAHRAARRHLKNLAREVAHSIGISKISR